MNTDLFINNEWRPATGAKRFDVINPATEEVAAQVAEADAGDVDAAVGAARTCFESDEWRKLSGRKRGAMLAKAADILASRLEKSPSSRRSRTGSPSSSRRSTSR
jgi:NAD-dependent aldehyde dehydrogenases